MVHFPQPVHQVTIIVPTYNRPKFLLRLLGYYCTKDITIPLLILDSSEAELTAELKELIKSNEMFIYRRFPSDIKPYSKLFGGVKLVFSPYVVICADDDFIVLDALHDAVSFLDANPDFSAVHGVSGLFSIGSINNTNTIVSTAPYGQSFITDAKGLDRLWTWISSAGSIFYATQRTQNLRQNLQICHKHEFGWGWGELALGGLEAIQGKVHKLDRLYMMREIHPERDSIADGWSADIFDWVVGDLFTKKYKEFEHCLCDALVQIDDIDIEEARAYVSRSFGYYIGNGLGVKWHHKYMPTCEKCFRFKLRDQIAKIPAARSLWRLFRSVIYKREDTSMRSIASPKNKYHSDYVPILKSVESSEENSNYA